MVEISPIIAADPLLLKSGILVGGVSAMPSLHIGMVSLTAYWLSSGLKYFKYITPIWVILVWISTVVLGWHYIFDGFGGLILGVLCILLNKVLFRIIED
jgi:membrane-associated phospholipid phosphatase